MILRPLIVVFMLGMTAVPSVRAADPLLSDGAFEMVTWTADLPNERWRDLCTLAADRVNCTMQKQYGDHTFATAIAGTLRGDDIVGRAHLRVTFRGPCSYVSEAGLSGTIHLLADGTLSSTWDSKGSTHSGMTGTCQGMPSSSPPGPPSHWSGTWRQLASVDLNALSPAPGAQVTLVTNDGRLVTIDLSQWQGSKLSVEQMALAKEFELKPPDGSPSYRLQAWQYPGARQGSLPMYVPMQRLDDTIAEGAQGAAAWVKANPGKASLAALGLAVSIMMPYVTVVAATAATATTAATGLSGVQMAGIGFFAAGTPGAVTSLVGDAAKGADFWTMGRRATGAFLYEGSWSLLTGAGGNVVGTAVEAGAAKFVGRAAADMAVKATGTVASSLAGSMADAALADLKEDTWNALIKASQAKIPDQLPQVAAASTGGIIMPLLSAPIRAPR